MNWTCHVCDKERPDEMISVAKHNIPVDGLPEDSCTRNVRCCNDSRECYDIARNPKIWKVNHIMKVESIEQGECFCKKTGTYAYLRMSDSSARFHGLDVETNVSDFSRSIWVWNWENDDNANVFECDMSKEGPIQTLCKEHDWELLGIIKSD